MSAMASPNTGFSIVYPTVCSGVDRRKHQSSASLAFVRGIHRWPVNSPHKGPVKWKMFPFDDVICGPVILIEKSLIMFIIDGTKPLLEPMLIYHKRDSVRFTWIQCKRTKCNIHDLFQNKIFKMSALCPRAPFTNMFLTVIPALISNYIHHKVWDDITYPFPNFSVAC